MDRTARILTTVLAVCAIAAAAASAIMQSSLLAAIAAASAAAAAVAALAGTRRRPAPTPSTPAGEEAPQQAAAPSAIQIVTDTLAIPAFRATASTPGSASSAETEEPPTEETAPQSPEESRPPSEVAPSERETAEGPENEAPAEAAAFVTTADIDEAHEGEAPESRQPVAPATALEEPVEAEELSTEAPAAIPAPAPEPPPICGITVPSGVEPRAVIGALYESAAAAGLPAAAYLWMEDAATSSLRLVAAAGTVATETEHAKLADSSLGDVLEAAEPHLLHIDTPSREALAGEQWRYAIPLIAGEQRGIAAVDFVGHAEPDDDTLGAVADHLRGALAGALAIYVAREETAAARLLIDTAAALSGLSSVDSLTNVALDAAMQIAGADTGSVMLADDEGDLRIVASHGLPAQVVSRTAIQPGEGIAGWVALTGRPVVIEDPGDSGTRSRHGVRSAVSVPIADEQGSLGVLNVGSRDFQPRLSRSTLAGLEVLGRMTASTLRCASAVDAADEECFDTLRALNAALEASDPYANHATERILALTDALAQELHLSPEDARTLRVASVLHDIGMAAAGETAFVGDRPLSTVEWGMLKIHPAIASDVLSKAPALRSVVPIVTHHHEHWDGSGYVAGLAGERIPLGARILAVADAFVAMTSHRPYRGAMTRDQALEELRANAGSQFDPGVVRAFEDLVSRQGVPDAEPA